MRAAVSGFLRASDIRQSKRKLQCSMRPLSLLACLTIAASAHGQASNPGKPLGTWNVEYERTISSMHSEPTKVIERGRMILRSVGDSVIGEMMVGDSATASHYALRGTARKDTWAMYIEEPPAHGFGIFFSALGAAMDWLKESVHGIHPVLVRFDLTAKGDSISGTRAVTGGMSAPRN